jgi:aryl-alcohol dehydrogenase/geraniol dehydrogenase (NAD+)
MSTHSMTNATAAVLRKTGAPLVVEPISISTPREDEVLVRMVGVGICHTDIACRDGFPVPLPIVLGHEGSGVVEAVGAAVKRVRVGDHVVLGFNSCGICKACKQARPAACAQFIPANFSGTRSSDGSTPLSQSTQPVYGLFFGQSSFATHAIARESNTVRVPAHLPLELLGPLGCGVMTGAGAVINSLNLQPGQSLAVFGTGAVGLSAVLAARAVGAGTVVVVEPSAKRRTVALSLGADHAFDPRDGDDIVASVKRVAAGGVDLALDTTAIPVVVQQALNCVSTGGALGLIGIPGPESPIPATLLDLLLKNVALRPIVEGDANPQTFIPKLLSLYEQGKFPFDRLIAKYPFAEINEAMHAAERGDVIKPVLIF